MLSNSIKAVRESELSGPLGHKNFSETRVQNQCSLAAVQDHLLVANPKPYKDKQHWEIKNLSALEEEPGYTSLESSNDVEG